MIVDQACYELLATSFQKKGLLLSTAETHGMMLGYLSTSSEPCFKTWTLLVDDILEWKNLEESIQDHLSKLFIAGHMELIQNVFDITLAMPSKDQPFLSQLSAMSDWCRGYLYGVGLSAPPSSLFSDHQLQSLLNDLTQFSQVSLQIETPAESQKEFDLIIEHIQQSVQIIYGKCRETSLELVSSNE